MIRHSNSNRDTGVSYLILTSLFLTGAVQLELDLSPNNGTIVTIGSNMTFTCSVIPCNEIGSMVLWYGHVQKLFSGICNETFYITDRRFEFSCNSAECMYSLNVYDVDITDHKRSMLCIYRSSSEDMLIKTTSIGVLDMLDDTYNFTTISPTGPFVDGESVDFKCCFQREDSPDTTLSFPMPWKLITQEIDNFTCLNLNVSIDIDQNRTKCKCTAQSKDKSFDVSSELQLVINQYDLSFELSPITNVVYDTSTTLACRVAGLQYPFAFGHWEYTNGKEEKSLISSRPIILKRIHTKHVNATLCSITVTFESFPDINIESLWTNNRKVKFYQSPLNRFVMKEIEKFRTEQKRVISFMDCLSSNVYGIIVSNGVIEEKFYFDETGELYNITPMLKMDGQFIDGEQASISCYDIIQSDASSLDLSCDNDDDTLCRCRSNKSNSESMLNIHIFPYKGYNVSHRKEVCESNSEIKLTCQDDNLPDVFHFGKWFHHYNDVEICKLAGFSSGKQTFIQIPFCTYEDVGNYTCSITDTRKNTTVLYSTTFLSVP
ncbi:Hypothetical predicted protein, partial [Mytilus galloprovincialis]